MHFGVPHRLISDNGTQFTSKKFENFCERHAIKHYQSSVYHPMTNSQVERANDIILQGIKTRIFDRLSAYDKKWVEVLPIVLWAVRTIANQAIGETLFFLLYGAKASPSPRSPIKLTPSSDVLRKKSNLIVGTPILNSLKKSVI